MDFKILVWAISRLFTYVYSPYDDDDDVDESGDDGIYNIPTLVWGSMK